MLYIMSCMFSHSKMGFALKESPFTLCVASLEAVFFSFVVNHTFLHVSSVLMVFKFYANILAKLLMSIFMALYKTAFNVIKCYQIWSNPKHNFFYNIMSFSGLQVCCIGLIWCILLGNFCFQTKPWVLAIIGLI